MMTRQLIIFIHGVWLAAADAGEKDGAGHQESVMPEVARLPWDVADWDATREIMSKEQAVVLTGLSSKHMPALSKWRWGGKEFLSYVDPPKLPMKVNRRSHVFIHWDDSEKHALMSQSFKKDPFAQWKMESLHKNVVFAQKDDANGTGKDRHMYFSGNQFPPKMRGDITSVRPVLCGQGCKFVTEQLWLSSSGIVAQAHYDLTDNTFVQVDGQKRFVLFPPNTLQDLHLYPTSIHPSGRQSQVIGLEKIFSPSSSGAVVVNRTALEEVTRRYPRVGAAVDEALTTLLNPGDVLFLPTGWGHGVTALGGCISYNIWSQSKREGFREALSPAISMGLNNMLNPQWGKPALIASTRVFLKLVAKALGYKDFARSHFDSRYKPLIDHEVLEWPLDRAKFCGRYQGQKKTAQEAIRSVAKVFKSLDAVGIVNELADLHDMIVHWMLQFKFIEQGKQLQANSDSIQFMRSLFVCSEGKASKKEEL